MSSRLNELEEARANAAARARMGAVAWPTMALGVAVLIGYGLVLAAAMSGAVPLWGALIASALLYYPSYTVTHEAVHGNIGGKSKSLEWLNSLFGYASAQINGAAFTTHRKEHLAHHRYTNKPGRDPDLYISDGRFISVIKGAFVALTVQLTFYLRSNWQDASLMERAAVVLEYGTMIAWRLAIVALGFWDVALVVFILGSFGGLVLLLTLFAWLVHRPYDVVGRYRDTSTIIFPRPIDGLVSWLWLFQNYHSIHHLFPGVPFYRYRDVFADDEDIMLANGAPIMRVGRSDHGAMLPSISN